MSEIKNITLGDIEKELDYGDQWTTIAINKDKRPIEIGVKRWISPAERGQMIDAILHMCFSEGDDELAHYRAFFSTFARYYNIVAYFTNVVMLGEEEDANTNISQRIDMLIRNTDIIDGIHAAVGDVTWYDLMEEIDEAIDYRRQEVLKQGRLHSVLSALEGLVNTISDKLEVVDSADLLSFIGETFPGLKDELSNIYKEETEQNK